MTNLRTSVFLILPLSLLCVVLLSLLSGWVFPFTTDSMFYISTAQSISQFKGLLFSNFFIQPSTPNLLPTIFEPPGYPILIAKLNFLGIDPYMASLFWPRLGLVLLPFLFFIVFKNLMPQMVAWMAAFLSTFMFSIIKCSLMAWGDIPYLCYSLISLAMAFVIIEKRGRSNIWFVFLAGLLAGCAFLIRYVGVTLSLSIASGLLLAFIFRIFSFKDFIKTACIYAVGIFCVVAPYLLRNWMVFGTLQPSRLPPSNVSLTVNIRDYLKSFSEMFFANSHFEMVVLILIVGLGVFFLIYAKHLLNQRKVYVFILLAYFSLNSLLLLGFKTVYLAPETINERYLIQLAWILMGGLVSVIYIGLKKLQMHFSLDIKSVAGLIAMAFILVQTFPAADFYFSQKKIKDLSKKVEQYSLLFQNLPEDFVIVSNVAEMTYLYAKRNVRMLGNYTPYGLVQVLGKTRKFVVFIIKEEQYSSPAWEYPSLWENPQGYGEIYSDANVDLLIPRS